MGVFLDGVEYPDAGTFEAINNQNIPEGLRTEFKTALEASQKPADASNSDSGTPVASTANASPEASRTGYPGFFNKLIFGDNPALPNITGGGPKGTPSLKGTEEDIDTAINVAMSTGPASIVGIGQGGPVYFRNAMKATRMEDAGATAKEIYQETGMFRDKGSSQWKREISDEEMRLVDKDWQYGDTGKLSDFVEHPKLFEEYPHLKDLTFKVAEKDYPYLGGFNSADNSITINPSKIHAGDEGILDVIAHELQHAIQKKAGFPQGSNPDRAMYDVGLALRSKMMEAASAKDMGHLDELLQLYKDIRDNASRFAEYMYQRVPGEVEANNTMARRKLTDQQRKEFMPQEMLDVLEGSANTMTGGKYYQPFHFPKYGERGSAGTSSVSPIRGAALKIGNDIFEGVNHVDAMEKAKAAGAMGKSVPMDGFVTQDGKFVTRKEALELVDLKKEQTPRQKKLGIEPGLASEDIPELRELGSEYWRNKLKNK